MEYKHRYLEKEILKYWDEKSLHIIKGPRRAGKTTLLKYLKKEKGGEYVSFDDREERDDFIRNPIEYVRDKEQPLFLDEVQHLGKEGGRALKRVYDELHDKGLKLLVSGSGAFDVKLELSSNLVGRAYFYTLLPLSFKEYIKWKAPLSIVKSYLRYNKEVLNALKGKIIEPPPLSSRIQKYLEEYVVFGGYPEVVIKKSKKELTSIIETTIDEDIIKYFGLREENKIWNVVRRLSALSGNILNYSELGVDHRTALHYLSIFSRSYVLYLLRTFSKNPLLELKKSKKVYFYDNGFRNALLGKFQPFDLRDDIGALIENFIFRQICYLNPRYWRTKNKAEVDFIIQTNSLPLPIEVKTNKIKPTRSLNSFIQKYNPKLSIIVAFDSKIYDNRILVVPPYYF